MRRWPAIGVALAWYWSGRPMLLELTRPWFKPGETITIMGTKIAFVSARLQREYLVLTVDVGDCPVTLHVPRDGRMKRAFGAAWRIA